MKSITKDAVKQAFAGVGLDGMNSSMLSKCTGLANSLHIQPKVMADCWEAFSLNKNIQELTEHSWQSFRTELNKEVDRNGNNNTPMDDGDDDNNNREGAVVARSGLGKRQVGSPDTAGSAGLALITPPTKRMATGNNKSTTNANSKSDPASAIDAIVSSRTAPTPSKASTPETVLSAVSTYTPPTYEERQGAGKVLTTFNPNDLKATTKSTTATTTQPKCGISYDTFDTNVQKPYRHLFTTMEDRAKALDQHLVRLEDQIKDRFDIMEKSIIAGTNNTEQSSSDSKTSSIAPMEGVGVPRQEAVCNIGRICNAAHEGRINLTSVVLEGSKHLGGARIEMDLSSLQEDKTTNFSLFPGQVVAVEGMNSTGRKMTPHRICEGAAHGANKSTARELLQFHHDESYQNGSPLKIMSVAGPYTTSDNLNYDPLYDFMGVVLKERPDVVVMVGPFVDMRHKDVQSGNAALHFEDGEAMSVPFETLFANKIAALLEDYFGAEDNLQTQFVLVPSLDDATAEWVYPQAPLQDRVFGERGKALKIQGGSDVEVGTLGLSGIEAGKTKQSKSHRRVHCVSNPCTLKINEVVIGVTGTDAIFHMSADESNANLPPGSRLARISQHMLQQRSYYPLFPPALGTNLDLKRMGKWNMPCQPDLLIVPSKLTSFARQVLEDTVVINPGHLSKNTTGGSFAVMDIHPMKRDDLEKVRDDVELPHNVADRMRLEIRKI